MPGPHKIYLANPKLLRTIVPTGAYFQTESTLAKAEIEIVTNVINGRWGAAYTNYEHEKIGIELGHLAPEKVAALIAGLPTSFEDPRQQVVYELSCTLAAARVVPVGLFRRAQNLVGDAGIVDVTALMGWFTAACLTLMAYDVPSDAVGLDQGRGSHSRPMRTTMFHGNDAPRLSLVDPDNSTDEVAEAFKLLPVIYVFRTMANAETLYPTYIAYVALLFKQLALDAALERMIVLRVARRSDCYYAWRQNVVVARSVGVIDEQITPSRTSGDFTCLAMTLEVS